MVSFTCDNCKKTFNRKINYDRHINKKVPCGNIEHYECQRCHKEFNKYSNYQQHLNRKNKCSINSRQRNKTNIELEREKTRQEEAKIEQEREKTRQEEIKMQKEIEKLKLKKEIMEKESENKKEEIELRRLKNLEIEQVKTDRKEKTASIINNINNQNIKIEVTNNINNIFDAKIVINSDKFKTKDVSHLFDIIQNERKMEQLCKDNKSLTNLLANIIKIAYNNDNFPESRYFISDKESEHFLSADENTGEYKIVEYEEIEKYLKKTTNKSFNEIKKIIDKKVLYRSKEEDFGLYPNYYINGKYTLKQPALIGLDPDNRILRSDRGFVRQKESNKYDGHFSDSSDEDEYD